MPSLSLGQALGSIVKGAPNRWLLVKNALQLMEDAVNNLGNHTAADPVGNTEPPPPIQALNIKVSGEMLHATIQHNDPIRKGIHYFLEIDKDPSFPQPLVVHFGASRAPTPIFLPTKNDGGDTVTYYARAYPQYPGSNPGTKVVFGGLTPTGITMGGTTQMTLLPSTGSGTAQATGQQGGYGFGVVQTRQAVQPKRFVG